MLESCLGHSDCLELRCLLLDLCCWSQTDVACDMDEVLASWIAKGCCVFPICPCIIVHYGSVFNNKVPELSLKEKSWYLGRLGCHLDSTFCYNSSKASASSFCQTIGMTTSRDFLYLFPGLWSSGKSVSRQHATCGLGGYHLIRIKSLSNAWHVSGEKQRPVRLSTKFETVFHSP